MPLPRIITRQELLDAGARNLREFGYPNADRENILSDDIFRKFFKSMVEETIQQFPSAMAAKRLLAEIEIIEGKSK